MTAQARLITIGFSHFCEKARWALDHAGVDYHEEDHAPLLHWRATYGAGGGRTVPVLVTPQRVLRDSNDILAYCDEQAPTRRLVPEDPARRAEVLQWVAQLDRGLGPAVRRFLYFHLLDVREVARDLLSCTGPAWERRLVRGVYPAMAVLMKRGLNISPATAERSRLKIEATLAAVEATLADGRRFLVGDAFTAADLTFASLVAVAVWPDQYGFPLPQHLVERVPVLERLRAATRARPAGQFALRLYAEQRPSPRGRA